MAIYPIKNPPQGGTGVGPYIQQKTAQGDGGVIIEYLKGTWLPSNLN
jgi:hypothetical protein